jgi:hypothetical protein
MGRTSGCAIGAPGPVALINEEEQMKRCGSVGHKPFGLFAAIQLLLWLSPAAQAQPFSEDCRSAMLCSIDVVFSLEPLSPCSGDAADKLCSKVRDMTEVEIVDTMEVLGLAGNGCSGSAQTALQIVDKAKGALKEGVIGALKCAAGGASPETRQILESVCAAKGTTQDKTRKVFSALSCGLVANTAAAFFAGGEQVVRRAIAGFGPAFVSGNDGIVKDRAGKPGFCRQVDRPAANDACNACISSRELLSNGGTRPCGFYPHIRQNDSVGGHCETSNEAFGKVIVVAKRQPEFTNTAERVYDLSDTGATTCVQAWDYQKWKLSGTRRPEDKDFRFQLRQGEYLGLSAEVIPSSIPKDRHKQLVSRNGRFSAHLSRTALFLFDVSTQIGVVGKTGADEGYLVMQNDCNVVAYPKFSKVGFGHPLQQSKDQAVWASNTAGKGANCFLDLQDDGNLVLYDGASKPLWSTGTVRK